MKILTMTIAAACAVALSACGSNSQDSGGPGSDSPIKLGAIISDTGTYAFAGTVAHAAMDLAVEKVNAEGGIKGRQLEIDYQDDGSATSQALTLLGKFAADRNTVAVVGPTATPIAMALGPVANARKTPLIGATVISGAPLGTGPWVFKTAANPSSIMNDLATSVATDLDLRNVAVVFGRDNEGQVEQKEAFEDGFKAAGGKIAAEVGVLNTDTNFGAAAQKIVNAKPDAVFVSLTGDASGNAVDQIRRAGLPTDVQILGTSQSVSPQYLKIGGDSVEGTVAGADYDPSLDTALNKEFTKNYEAAENQLPDAYAALGYESVLQIAHALESIEGDITRESIQKAMSTTRSFEGVLGNGEYSIGKDRVPTYAVALLEVVDGAYKTFE